MNNITEGLLTIRYSIIRLLTYTFLFSLSLHSSHLVFAYYNINSDQYNVTHFILKFKFNQKAKSS